MRILAVIMLLSGAVLAGCAPARIYTFERERVDQDMSGNRGYAKGAPPAEVSKTEVPKRTLIGIDFEIGLLPSEKEKIKQRRSESVGEISKENIYTPPAEAAEEGGEKTEEKICETEEEWIK